MESVVALIGLGAVGVPIAHELYHTLGNDFVLLSDTKHYTKVKRVSHINNQPFYPKIVTDTSQLKRKIDILFVAVKNYDLIKTLEQVDQYISNETILIPLQNGIWAEKYLRNKYKTNVVAECYVQGPDTQKLKEGFRYTKPGVIHIGTSKKEEVHIIKTAFEFLRKANLNICYEENINLMTWKKWMLNVAGNTVTALTGANYSDFDENPELPNLCRKIMEEFLVVARLENIGLTEEDVDEVIAYFTGFKSGKITSMLEDVSMKRQTENEYITGELLRIAALHGIDLPINRTIYMLIKIKESLYR